MIFLEIQDKIRLNLLLKPQNTLKIIIYHCVHTFLARDIPGTQTAGSLFPRKTTCVSFIPHILTKHFPFSISFECTTTINK